MGWARVAPSRCLLLFILLTTAVTLCACLASSVMVWLAPQVPYSQTYSGGAYTHYPALSLAASALLSILSVLLGCCGLSRDSKAALILVCDTCSWTRCSSLLHTHTCTGLFCSTPLQCWWWLGGSWPALEQCSHLPIQASWRRRWAGI